MVKSPLQHIPHRQDYCQAGERGPVISWEEDQDTVLGVGRDEPSLGGRGLFYLPLALIQALGNFVALPVR